MAHEDPDSHGPLMHHVSRVDLYVRLQTIASVVTNSPILRRKRKLVQPAAQCSGSSVILTQIVTTLHSEPCSSSA